jgi:EAL and modified HD-GYP domain-containing signal transduction protein
MEESIDAMGDGPRSLVATAYLTGMLSLLHVACHMELRHFVDELPVSDAIREAILNGGGLLGELLSIAALLEQGDADAAAVRLQPLVDSSARLQKLIECY